MKLAIAAAILFASLMATYKLLSLHRPRSSSSLFPKKFYIIAHRGGAALAPENTMAAFEDAALNGFAFELDTQLTKDGRLIVFHDYSLERTSSGSGSTESKTYDELMNLDVGSHFSKEFSNERIPLLSSVLQRFNGKVPIIIEVKCEDSNDKPAAIAKKLVELLENGGFAEKVVVASFNPYVLSEVKKLNSNILRAQIYSKFKHSKMPSYKKLMLTHLMFNWMASPDILMPSQDIATKSYIRKMQRRGYKVFPWTVDDESEMNRLIGDNADGIITNDPIKLAKLRT